jgi:hypothetical protein
VRVGVMHSSHIGLDGDFCEGQCASRLSAEERQHGEHATMLVG